MVIAFNMEQFVSNHLEHLNLIHPPARAVPPKFADTFLVIYTTTCRQRVVDAIHFWVGAVPFTNEGFGI